MKPIGGFFELELPQGGANYHSGAIGLSTGRACLGVFIEQMNPKKVFVPYYTCDATYHPFQLRNIPLEYYEINADLEPTALPVLKEGEYFLYTNYFGIKEDYTLELAKRYGTALLVDNTHCYFYKGYEGIWSFTSARKHFGVPDGAYLYPGKLIDVSYPVFEGITILPYFNRLMGDQELGFKQYQVHEASLDCDVYRISNYSDRMLAALDYEKIRKVRISNFDYLHQALKDSNRLGDIRSGSPFCYPYWPLKGISPNNFHINRIFVPSYWKEIQNRRRPESEFSAQFSEQVVPLPVDHRYGKEEMDRIIEVIVSS
jgi:hypothetical protein